MTLRQTQSRFVVMIAQLINHATDLGYELTFGDAYRDPRVFGDFGESVGYGEAHSCHKLRLAVDFNLFIDGQYRQDRGAYAPLGDYWQSIGGTWGGAFTGKNAGDANHFSVEWGGRS